MKGLNYIKLPNKSFLVVNSHKSLKKSIRLYSVHELQTPIYTLIFTFLKQSFNESLDFCNRSQPHELHKFDLQLPSSLARAIRFEH